LVTSIRRFWFDDFNKVESIFVTTTDAKVFIENKIRKLKEIKMLFMNFFCLKLNIIRYKIMKNLPLLFFNIASPAILAGGDNTNCKKI
jgi:hypothetical protein